MARTGTAIALVATLVATPAMAQIADYSTYDTDAALGLSDTEFRGYSEETFGRYDADRDSYLSDEEYGAFGDAWGRDQDFDTWDADGDSRLGVDEFHTGLFGTYDADRNLMIDETEFGDLAGQVGGLDNTVQTNKVVTLSEWRYDDLYGEGVSVEEMIDGMAVWGAAGDEIGEVENVLFGPNGQVLALVAQIGGFWDIGDTHVSIPWELVEVGTDNIVVPVTEDTVDDYSVFNETYLNVEAASSEIQQVEGDGFGEVETGLRVWRATDLIGDYARIQDAGTYQNYGYVNDIIIRNGQIAATVISPDTGYGAGVGSSYAYPYTGYAGGDYYDLPYGRSDVDALEPYDYNRMTWGD